MHLTREALDAWASSRHIPAVADHKHLIRLEEGDSLSWNSDPKRDNTITGPALVELVVYRDGGWSARELVYETPESIALAASLAQRQKITVAQPDVYMCACGDPENCRQVRP